MPEHTIQSNIVKQLTIFLRQRHETVLEYIRLMDLMEKDLAQGDVERLVSHSTNEREVLNRLKALQRAISSLREEHPAETQAKDARANTSTDNTILEKQFQQLHETAVQKIFRNRSRLDAALRTTGDEISRVRRARAKTGRTSSTAKTFYIDIER